MPDVVQRGEKGLAKVLFLLTALPGNLRQCGCVGWGLFLVWSCGPKVPELGCAPCPELREWEVGGRRRRQHLPSFISYHKLHIQGDGHKLKPCPCWIRDEQKYQVGFRKRLEGEMKTVCLPWVMR